MKKVISLIFAITLVFVLSSTTFAVPLSGQYSVNVTTDDLGTNSWRFTYDVYNVSQQTSQYTGLDGFYVQVPNTVAISEVTVPAPYWGSGYWDEFVQVGGTPNFTPEATLQPNHVWLGWWGQWPQSVYPIGSTATFSFRADNADVGQNLGAAVTYWGGSYTGYSFETTAPVEPQSVPEPATLFLLGSGVVGMIGFCKKKEEEEV